MDAVIAALGIGGAGLVADAAGRAVVVVDTCWVVLGIEAVPARIIHKLAIVVGAKVAGLARVVVAVAIAAAAVVDDAEVVIRWLALDAVAVIVGAVVIAMRCLAFDVTVGGGVVVLGNLCLLRLRYRGRIAISDS